MKIKNFKDFKKEKGVYVSKSSKNSIEEYEGTYLCYNRLDESSSNILNRSKVYAKNIFKAFKSEAGQTSNMISVFNRKLRSKLKLKNRKGNPTPKEIEEALKQLKDIPKLAPYAIILLTSPIPFSSTMYASLSFYLKKVSKGKIDLLPDSFDGIFEDPNSDIEDN